MDVINQEILDLYDALIDNGITFYYGSEEVSTGEIIEFNISEDYIIEITMDDFNTYEVTVEEFIEYHSKEGANYHTWNTIRNFDKKLSEIL
ncbi:MAG: hypothetical protein IJO26_02690 [Clostridium sp.]|nr:hypothetical protein [Clostridium sp.]